MCNKLRLLAAVSIAHLSTVSSLKLDDLAFGGDGSRFALDEFTFDVVSGFEYQFSSGFQDALCDTISLPKYVDFLPDAGEFVTSTVAKAPLIGSFASKALKWLWKKTVGANHLWDAECWGAQGISEYGPYIVRSFYEYGDSKQHFFVSVVRKEADPGYSNILVDMDRSCHAGDLVLTKIDGDDRYWFIVACTSYLAIFNEDSIVEETHTETGKTFYYYVNPEDVIQTGSGLGASFGYISRRENVPNEYYCGTYGGVCYALARLFGRCSTNKDINLKRISIDPANDWQVTVLKSFDTPNAGGLLDFKYTPVYEIQGAVEVDGDMYLTRNDAILQCNMDDSLEMENGRISDCKEIPFSFYVDMINLRLCSSVFPLAANTFTALQGGEIGDDGYLYIGSEFGKCANIPFWQVRVTDLDVEKIGHYLDSLDELQFDETGSREERGDTANYEYKFSSDFRDALCTSCYSSNCWQPQGISHHDGYIVRSFADKKSGKCSLDTSAEFIALSVVNAAAEPTYSNIAVWLDEPCEAGDVVLTDLEDTRMFVVACGDYVAIFDEARIELSTFPITVNGYEFYYFVDVENIVKKEASDVDFDWISRNNGHANEYYVGNYGSSSTTSSLNLKLIKIDPEADFNITVLTAFTVESSVALKVQGATRIDDYMVLVESEEIRKCTMKNDVINYCFKQCTFSNVCSGSSNDLYLQGASIDDDGNLYIGTSMGKCKGTPFYQFANWQHGSACYSEVVGYPQVPLSDDPLDHVVIDNHVVKNTPNVQVPSYAIIALCAVLAITMFACGANCTLLKKRRRNAYQSVKTVSTDEDV